MKEEKALQAEIKDAVKKKTAHSLAFAVMCSVVFMAGAGSAFAAEIQNPSAGTDAEVSAPVPVSMPENGNQAPADTSGENLSESAQTNTSADTAVETPAGDEKNQVADGEYLVQKNADVILQITDLDGNAVRDRIVTLSDGSAYYAQEDGMIALNQIVSIGDKKYFAKENGCLARKELCTDREGNTYYALADRSLASDRTVTVSGTIYYASSDCTIVKDGFYTTAKGSLIYAKSSGQLMSERSFHVDGKQYYAKISGAIATGGFCVTEKGSTIYTDESGAVVENEVFSVNGKLYYAKPSGVIASDGFHTMKSGRKVYAKKSGELAVNKLLKVRGYKFYADENGTVVRDKWVTVGNKQYYCSKSCNITKERKIKA